MFKHICAVFCLALTAALPMSVPAAGPSAPGADTGSWRGEYYNNRNLSGSPELVRNDPEINFIWQGGSPAPGTIYSENFSVRWTRTVNIPAGWYRFRMSVDDGGRLWVNDQLVVDAWQIQSTQNRDVNLHIPGGTTLIRMEYFQTTGDAVALLSWDLTALSPAPDMIWRGEYFNNTSLSGPPALVRDERQVHFNWGNDSPSDEINTDNFSARWTTALDLPAGWYMFNMTVDDGGRLWVNSQLLIDEWRMQSQRTYAASFYLSGGVTDIRMEYFDTSGIATAALSWELGSSSIRNWRGEYYNNTSLAGSPSLVRDDPEVDFNWGSGSPAPGAINADSFSARWTRTINLPPGKYWFAVTSDDGVRLWVNNQFVIDAWHTQPPTTSGGEVDIHGGTTSIRMEYYEDTGDAQVILSWARAPDAITNWRGEYFNNMALRGAPVLVRDDTDVNFDWDVGSPAPGVIGVDTFSVRWTRTVDFTPGWYHFSMTSDDGSQLFIDNVLRIDAWQDRIAQKSTVDIYLSGQTSIRMEYFNNSGVASAHLSWDPLVAMIKNWRGEYFNTTDMSGAPALVRDDADINFNWRDASPAPGTVDADHFSVRWTRSVDLPDGWYRFTIVVDDGGRLWVNDRLLIDAWNIQGPHPYEGDIYLTGRSTNIRLEYFENTGWASVRWYCQAMAAGQATTPCLLQ